MGVDCLLFVFSLSVLFVDEHTRKTLGAMGRGGVPKMFGS